MTCTLPTCILHPYCIHTVDLTSRSPSHRHALFRPHLHLRLPYPPLLICSTLPVRWNNFGGNKPKTDVTARTHTSHLLGGTFLRHTIHVDLPATSYLLPPNRSSLLRRVAIIGFDLCSPSLCTTRARVTTWPPASCQQQWMVTRPWKHRHDVLSLALFSAGNITRRSRTRLSTSSSSTCSTTAHD